MAVVEKLSKKELGDSAEDQEAEEEGEKMCTIEAKNNDEIEEHELEIFSTS